jgi:hypothetical protein
LLPIPFSGQWRLKVLVTFETWPLGRRFHANTITNIETGRYAGKPETVAAIKKALERVGIEFTTGGVRLAT